jgi:hypothetical protein
MGALDEGKCHGPGGSIVDAERERRSSSHRADANVHPHRAAMRSEETFGQAVHVVGERHAQQRHGVPPFRPLPVGLLHPGGYR